MINAKASSPKTRENMRTLLAGLLAGTAAICIATTASAETFNLKVASGHPRGQHYVDYLHDIFIPELKKRALEKGHTVNVTELFAGSAVKVSETLEGLGRGIVDIAGMCYCFEPSKLKLNTFQAFLPFGPGDPTMSVGVAREVYAKIPQLTEVFSEQNNQKLLVLFPQDPYDLHAKYPIEKLDDIQNKKFGGAGANLPWVSNAGGIGVQTSGATVYTSMQTGVFDGLISQVSLSQGFKLYEVAKYFTKVGFGSLTWHGIQINNDTYASLPAELQDIVVTLSQEMEADSGRYMTDRVSRGLEVLQANGVIVSELPQSEKARWADLLKDWPIEKAKELDEAGLPGSDTMNAAIVAAEKLGYTWPIRYQIK